MANEPSPVPQNTTINFRLDLRLVVAILLITIAGMLALWRPWEGKPDRTVDVTGQATLKVEPDEFVFYPTYSFKNSDKTAALSELTKKSDEIVKKLKELGVPDSKLKTNANSYREPLYFGPDEKENTHVLQLTITATNKALAQKVQDYLVTTNPEGAITPAASFSENKRKELENKAREAATKDARSQADQTAKNLGFSIGKIKAVTDGVGFNAYPASSRSYGEDAKPQANDLTLQPGENELHYSVSVTYYIY